MEISKMKVISAILLFGLLAGCTPQRHLDRYLDRHPELAIRDTLVVEHETIIESVEYDTTFSESWFYSSDTVYFHKERLSVQFVRDPVTRNITFHGRCEGDTIRETIRVPYTKYEYQEPGWWKQHWLEILIVLAIAALFLKILRTKAT